ncbi:15418_t:CDS:2, partial [Funneliformis caledonium]
PIWPLQEVLSTILKVSQVDIDLQLLVILGLARSNPCFCLEDSFYVPLNMIRVHRKQ